MTHPMQPYRVRIYGAGADGNTPPVAEQPVLFDVIVQGYEAPWFDGDDTPCLHTVGIPFFQAAYHGGGRGRSAMLAAADKEDATRREWWSREGECPLSAMVVHYDGLRVDWEPAAP